MSFNYCLVKHTVVQWSQGTGPGSKMGQTADTCNNLGESPES